MSPVRVGSPFGHDKVLHWLAGFSVSAIGGALASPYVDKDWFVGLVLASIAGVGKEVVDSFGYGDCDVTDALVTVFGGVVAAALLYVR